MQGSPAPPAVPPNVLEITLALAFAAALAGVIALAVGRIARHFLVVVGRESLAKDPIVQRTIRAVRGMSFVVAFAVLAFLAIDYAGVELGVDLESEGVRRWATVTGARILGLLLLAFVIVRILSAVIVRAESEMVEGTGLDALERRKRAQTIASLVRRALAGVIWATAILIVLRELDVDITPVLTGAGILGLAIGFGAQTLVRDVITGFFLIVEDQVRVGDVATVNGIGGLVEQINLRTIVLRDMEGVVHVVPNGEIKTLANRTKDFAYYVIDLGVDYNDDVDRVMELVREAGAQLMADATFAPFILQPVEVLGVDAFTDSSVTLKIRIKTVPLKQWEIGRELRRRIKQVMDREGLRIPSPQLEVRIHDDRRARP